MRYHFLLKSLALILAMVLLCTVTVCGVGIFVLKETGLYQQSIDDAYGQHLQQQAQSYAEYVLRDYLSRELGGATPQMTQNYYGSYSYRMFRWDKAGYRILDESGQVCASEAIPSAAEAANRFVFTDLQGQYLKIHETVPAQLIDAPKQLSPERSYVVAAPEHLIFDSIPEGGAMVHRIRLTCIDSEGEYESPNGLGEIFHLPGGEVSFTSSVPGLSEVAGGDVTHILFENDRLGVLYEASCPGGVGALGIDGDGYLNFTAWVTSPGWTAGGSLPDNAPEEGLPEESVPVPETVQISPAGTLTDPRYSHLRYYDDTGTQMVAFFTYETMPDYTVEVVLAENALHDESSWMILGLLQPWKDRLVPILGTCLALLGLCVVYLSAAAARRPGTEERRAGGLNRFPLDGYLVLAIGGICAAAVIGMEGMEYLVDGSREAALGLGGLMAFLAAALLVGFCFAFVAQIKTPDGYWWKNTLMMRCMDLCLKLSLWCIRAVKWLFRQLMPVIRWAWNFAGKILGGSGRLVGRCFGTLWSWFYRFVQLLPLTWQWLLGGGAIAVLMLIAYASRNTFAVLLSLACCAAVILYGTHAFGILLEAVERMGKGDLEQKVDSHALLGSFQRFGEGLNALAGVAVVAARKQLKSERMKTELITNVSHDIKTPLTSIINYVDLLQKPHTQQQEQEYLEVLSRQSQRLKKLIADLMDMSKASTGNMAVDLRPLDAVEAVNQALGEFSDKLEAASLISVFRQPEEKITILADGVLTWRVLSNLLSNAVKYALPGTRVYLDITANAGSVMISIKNISREELNVEAEELLERFVRGDASRNTEGSGLGLNIAQSLMQLQHGSLQILVDGDLFKVTLTFPEG